jgi:hypothetical protein
MFEQRRSFKMHSFVKRNILIALIGVFPTVVGVESAAGHSGGGSSGTSGSSGSSGGHGGGGHGNGNSWSAPTGAHSSTVATTAHMSGGSFAALEPHATGDAASGRFIHTGPGKNAKQRNFATGYVPNSWVDNNDWRKRHHYHRISSP